MNARVESANFRLGRARDAPGRIWGASGRLYAFQDSPHENPPLSSSSYQIPTTSHLQPSDAQNLI